MHAAIRTAAPLVALAVAAILAGCAVEPAPYYDEAYVYSGPSAVFVGPAYRYGYYGHYDRYAHAYGAGARGRGDGMHGHG